MTQPTHPSDGPDATQRAAGSSVPPTVPEPEDVDALLSESLRAETEDAFSWKEPQRRPRWWERAEQTGTLHTAPAPSPAAQQSRGVRLGPLIVGGACLLLAWWVLVTVAFGITIDPLFIALAVCTLAGVTLVAAGLRPKPGARL
ncbi:hypothetical protein [Nesterenkonia alba]|uniref:hypothetical protein n=1 Tax=Nesterenkonia alba TaxID=515814 RepID=UPI0012EBD73E|nr:hypothetical protein [Nesterenkonia alba]